ncbi:DUF805 domain-containing protein [Rothia sp. ZJ932]|uniref:DUF805 domain-containing protein n=1 Tax=Rothia sp. ZJ932 TaxID=2810516 RepID=UPI00196803D9|nr:DUF805 domain-containing protein [Rothia sp. ZJ932]QRZ62182.1 DUF805 domain-containing protein [Rothia sp. ZJ932]
MTSQSPYEPRIPQEPAETASGSAESSNPSSSTGSHSAGSYDPSGNRTESVQNSYVAPGADSQPSSYSGQYPYGQGAYNSGYSTPGYGVAGYGNAGYVSKPRPHVGFGQAHKNWFKYMFHFSGRASRSEYWWVQLSMGLVLMLLLIGSVATFVAGIPTSDSSGELTDAGVVAMLTGFGFYTALLLVALIFSVLTLGLGFRRLQDAGFPGWLYLLSFVGLSIVPFVMSIFPSKVEGYQYDKPKDIDRP